jgi:uncharacterized cupin superfamily protein
MGVTHFEEANRRSFEIGHLRSTWTFLGEAAGSVRTGVRRIEIPAGGWSTPVHDHSSEEEVFYVLSGRGLAWEDESVAPIGSGDCIVCLAGRGAHSLYARDGLDLLAFGLRLPEDRPRFPRQPPPPRGTPTAEGLARVTEGAPIQFVREAELGPPRLPNEPGPRPATIVNLEDTEPERIERPRVVGTRRNLGRAAGSVAAGLQHVEVGPGKESTAQHCHSVEEEIFVILGGTGVLVLGDDETPVRAGHVVARPPGTGVAHVFRAGDSGLTYLAYGTRDPSDVCYYPRSNKIAFRGVGVMARLERLDYWDGEDG